MARRRAKGLSSEEAEKWGERRLGRVGRKEVGKEGAGQGEERNEV